MSSKKGYRSYEPIRPAASRMLAKRWDTKAYEMHRKKLKNTKPTVDTRPPKTYMHLQLKLKKLQMEEERLANIEKDNRILLEKMSHIMRTRGRVDNVNDYKHKSLNKQKRQQELLRITHENQAILKRITAKQPFYDHSEWEKDYDKSTQFKSQITRFPKENYSDDESSSSDSEADSRSRSRSRSRSQSRGDSRTSSAAKSKKDDADKKTKKKKKKEPVEDTKATDTSEEKKKDANAEDGGDDSDKEGFTKKRITSLVAPGEAEQEALSMINDAEYMKNLWKQCDYNGNGGCSLAEIDKMVVEKGWKLSKPTLMRAYKKTTLQDGDGDAWVERKEFPSLIRNLFLFENLWELFDNVDSSDDRRIDEGEFYAATKAFASKKQANEEFKKIDKNGGGYILFKEFCDHLLGVLGISAEDDDAKWKEEGKSAKTASKDEPKDFNGLDKDAIRKAVAPGEAEQKALEMINDVEYMKKLWNECDYNGNGGCSLAELDKMVVDKGWKFSKPTLMRAYKKTTLKDGDGDAWVERKEFPDMIKNLFLFENLWGLFDDLDTEDDRRVDLGEFTSGMAKIGCRLSPDDAKAEFGKADKNGGGQILFKEFCDYIGDILGVGMEDAGAKWKEEPKKKQSESKQAAQADTSKFDAVESELMADLGSKDKVSSYWKSIDFNGNDIVSLAEIDKWVKEKYPVLDSKPALMRAYKKTINSAGGDGDYVKKNQFAALLGNIFYFNKLFVAFDGIDTDDDRRLDLEEFKQGASIVGLTLNDKEAQAEFDAMDTNDGGKVLFDEFAAWAAKKKIPVD